MQTEPPMSALEQTAIAERRRNLAAQFLSAAIVNKGTGSWLATDSQLALQIPYAFRTADAFMAFEKTGKVPTYEDRTTD